MKLEHKIILDLIQPESQVLELGCADGDLLALLTKEKKVKASGLEINEQAIYKCVARGLSVFHGDIEAGLSEYPDNSFDYVIMDQTFQELKKIDYSLKDALRVGKKVIITFSNFAYYISRLQIFFLGRTPITKALPYEWFDTPNLHFLSITDFINYCNKRNIKIIFKTFICGNKIIKILPNLFGELGVFVVSK